MSNYVVTNIRLPAVIREKVSKKKDPEEYAKQLLSLKTDWFSYKEFKKNRTTLEKRLGK